MSNNKLQELTDRLYQEGLSKGRQEAEQVLEDAKKEAARIIADAKAQAEKTVAEAKAQADDIVAKAASDVKMASTQALGATKADIQNAILAKVVDQKVNAALAEDKFICEVILNVAKNFSTENNCDLELTLGQNTSEKVLDYVKNEVAKAIGVNIEVVLSKKIKGGLTIGPKDGAYFVSLTDETFSELIREYLRPATRKTLFGE